MTNPPSPQQFFVAHRSKATGAATGTGIRAASTREPALLRQALQWSKYELPLELSPATPTSADSPRRLSRLRADSHSVWVLHSAHSGSDLSFTHAVRIGAVDPATVLRTWGSPAWALEEPYGGDDFLSPSFDFEPGTLVHDAAITRFLTQPILGASGLATVVCPPRLLPAAQRRRGILLEFLAGLQLAHEGLGQRRRLFVHAEPGLIALLLYAAVRLLPEAIGSDVTFTTFEPAHRSLNGPLTATVIGTYFGQTETGFALDALRARGYWLDTFYPERSCPELAARAEELGEYLDRALAGVWIDADPKPPEGTADALERVEQGFASADDLLLLGGYEGGMKALRERDAVVWPQLRCLATIHPELIPKFLEWFREPESVKPFLRAAYDAAADEDALGWHKYWRVVTETQDPELCTGLFLGILRRHRRDLLTLTRPSRAILRREAVNRLSEATPEMVPLLYPGDVGECEEILNDTKLPAKWRGFALASTLKTSRSRLIRRDVYSAALAFLPRAPVEVLREYILRAQHIYAEHPELWSAVAESDVDRCLVVDLLLELGTVVPPSQWKKLLDSLDAFAADGPLRGDRLARLLATVGIEPDGWPVWEAAVAQLDLRFLKGDFTQASEWSAVERARQRATRPRKREREKPFPALLAAKLEAGMTLQRWMTQPIPGDQAAHLHAAFAVLGCPLPTTLRTVFHSAFGSPTVGSDLPKVERFAQMFQSLYPVSPGSTAAVTAWESIANSVPSPHRESLQGYFWTRMIPAPPEESPSITSPTKPTPAAAPGRSGMFEVLLYAGIIAAVGLLIGALLLFW